MKRVGGITITRIMWHAAAWFVAVWLVSSAATSIAQTNNLHLPTKHVPRSVLNGSAPFLSNLDPQQEMHIILMLPLRNQTELKALLAHLYDPSSPDFHKFLSVKQFTDQFGPSTEDYQAVVDFAQQNGFSVGDVPPNRLLVELDGTVAQVNQTFHVTMRLYRHPKENRVFFAPDREPSVDLSVPLWHIAGLDNYSIPRPLYLKRAQGTLSPSNTTGSGPSGSLLGSDRRTAYYDYVLNGAGQSVGLVEFDGYNSSDVEVYFANVGQTLNVPINNVLLDGASGGSDGDDTEQVIDIVEAISMAPALSQVRVYIAPQSTLPVYGGDGDVLIFNKMASENIAKQLSSSWNWSPADPSTDDPIFEEFAAQGQSLFQASGDYGAWPSDPYFFPEEDAHVTAVGGTVLTTDGAGGPWESEIAWGGSNTACSSGTGSGGGISPDDIAIPSYQQSSGVINSSNHGSTTYRNAPDIAAEADCDNYYCANGACGEGLGGTSLAAPTLAGLTALVNQSLALSCRSSVGFINSAIYSLGTGSGYANAFHDITVGDNYTSGSPNLFPAVTGYDLVTGWGSPAASTVNGKGLLNALVGVPAAYTWTPWVSAATWTTQPPGHVGYYTFTLTDENPDAFVSYAIYNGSTELAAGKVESGSQVKTSDVAPNTPVEVSIFASVSGCNQVTPTSQANYECGVTGTCQPE